MYQNKVTLIGFLGNDAEFRTNDNRSFTTLSLATKSSYKKDGQYISHTEWHRCVIFGKLSEFAGTLKKGAHLQVEGELRSREYETKKVGKKPAQKKTIWEIRVNSILKLDRAEKASTEEQDDHHQGSQGDGSRGNRICDRQGRWTRNRNGECRLYQPLSWQRLTLDRELGSHPADLRCHPCRFAAAHRSRGRNARCRTGEGGVMQTILRILKQAGGWHHGLYLKIENPPYMTLVIEATDESGPCGLPSISVAHYGEQNGDLMRDPEMCFELGLANGPHLNAFYYRHDYVGVEQWSRTIVRENYVYLVSLHQQHERFAKVWDNNLRLQGFAEAFEQQQTPRA